MMACGPPPGRHPPIKTPTKITIIEKSTVLRVAVIFSLPSLKRYSHSSNLEKNFKFCCHDYLSPRRNFHVFSMLFSPRLHGLGWKFC